MLLVMGEAFSSSDSFMTFLAWFKPSVNGEEKEREQFLYQLSRQFSFFWFRKLVSIAGWKH
jgi:hypothetical protein